MVFVMFSSSQAAAQNSVTATWDRNADSYTAGYRLYYGTATGSYQWSVDVGNQNSAPLNLSPGRYFFTVRAYTTAYQQGPQATEATLEIADPTLVPTASIQATLQNGTTAVVNWQSTNAVSATINGTTVQPNGSTTVAVTATTTFTIVVRSANGATATASATVTVAPPPTPPTPPTPNPNTAPLAPTSVAASVSGNTVTVSWQPNATGGTPTQYVLYVGTTAWGTEVVKGQSVGNVLSVTADLPPGTYYARIRARNARGISVSNTPVQFRIAR